MSFIPTEAELKEAEEALDPEHQEALKRDERLLAAYNAGYAEGWDAANAEGGEEEG